MTAPGEGPPADPAANPWETIGFTPLGDPAARPAGAPRPFDRIPTYEPAPGPGRYEGGYTGRFPDRNPDPIDWVDDEYAALGADLDDGPEDMPMGDTVDDFIARMGVLGRQGAVRDSHFTRRGMATRDGDYEGRPRRTARVQQARVRVGRAADVVQDSFDDGYTRLASIGRGIRAFRASRQRRLDGFTRFARGVRADVRRSFEPAPNTIQMLRRRVVRSVGLVAVGVGVWAGVRHGLFQGNPNAIQNAVADVGQIPGEVAGAAQKAVNAVTGSETTLGGEIQNYFTQNRVGVEMFLRGFGGSVLFANAVARVIGTIRRGASVSARLNSPAYRAARRAGENPIMNDIDDLRERAGDIRDVATERGRGVARGVGRVAMVPVRGVGRGFAWAGRGIGRGGRAAWRTIRRR